MASFIYPTLQQAIDETKPGFMTVIPAGYTIVLGPYNMLVGAHPQKPPIYLDESTMQWRVLEVHISEVAKDART